MHEEALIRLNQSRKELLDLGLRNPLINHGKRRKQVPVVDELSTEIYRILVTKGRTMEFESLSNEKLRVLAGIRSQKEFSSPKAQLRLEIGSMKEELVADETDADSVDWSLLLGQPNVELTEGELAKRHIDMKLQTELSSEMLQSQLLSIRNKARTCIEEQGVNFLFLALGFLYWYEAPSATEPRRAPLILIPVELKRASAGERFLLSHTGEDIGDNLSLIEKAKVEFNLDLPSIQDSEQLDLEAFFKSVERAIKESHRWKVDPNEMTLGFFSFGKFLMYKDLDSDDWPAGPDPAGSDLLSSLLTDGLKETESIYGEETYIDEVVAPADVHQIIDADSSQILAILDVNDERNLVLQGPPGTGKSQTITNIIAECIGKGKKVLFVAEKMAALDVVKRRLDEAGLGVAVLELHSHKTNKKQVVEELDRTLHLCRPRVDNPDEDIDFLTILRDKLNTYCKAVNTPVGNTRMSFVSALGNANKNAIDDSDHAPFPFEPMANWSESEYRSARMQVEALDRNLAEAGPPERHPFKGSPLTDFLPSQKGVLERALDAAKSRTDELDAAASSLADAMGLQAPDARNDVEVICRAARRAMEAPHLEGLALTSGEWQARRDDVAELIKAGRKLRDAHRRFDEWLIDAAWEQDLLEVRQHYVTKGSSWWRFLSGDFRRARSRMQGLCRQRLPKDVSQTVAMINTVLDSQKYKKRYDELAPLGKSLFGAQWKRKQSDWVVLEKLFQWVVSLYRSIGDGELPEGIVLFLSGSPRVDDLRENVEDVEARLQSHETAAKQVAELLKLDFGDGAQAHWDLTLDAQTSRLNNWREATSRLDELVRYNHIVAELSKKGLGFITSVTRDWQESPGSLLRLFDYSWYNGLVEFAYSNTDAIKDFDRGQHENFVLKEFSRLDLRLFRHNRQRLISAHWKSIPSLSGGGELQIIRREIHKKRRHLPIRKLLAEAGQAIQAIKPVFMMSPMSIATYAPPGSLQFDLVVFDEASQVKPVDAFGAILRAKKTVVVGDSKQLPPTSFFDSLVERDEEEDVASIGDMDSILDLFLAANVPQRMLRWHYRSQHESLIAVSNDEFYDNRLVVFPSPGNNPIARGLSLRYLPETSYDRGKTRTNPDEAKAVAEAVFEHAKTLPDLTLGVVAFSVPQRDAVELQLEILRRKNPTCEPFFSESKQDPFFVKNLENVQGDERDVIFITVGYGKTAEGYLSMSFGPLNRDGGERRLNVLISRAKLAMDVFSNFTAADIDLNRTSAWGVKALKKFLAYAESWILEQPYTTSKEPDSDFELSVIRALQQHGVEVEPQVGTAGFFIDIGIKNPERPGQYLLGIECDGAMYHSSRSARDRDRLRQEVLERRGWRLHRIWSTDWYRDSRQALDRALRAIEKAKQSANTSTSVMAKTEIESTAKSVRPLLERETQTRQELTDANSPTPYTKATLKISLGNADLHELSVQRLCGFVAEVVTAESPVHTDEVIRRVTEGAGLKRSGSRIKKALSAAVALGKLHHRFEERDGFLWAVGEGKTTVRDRSHLENASKKFEWVAPEEIKEAVYDAVESSFSSSADDVVSVAAGRLGFNRVSAHARELFDTQIELLVKEGRLENREDLLRVPK